MSRLRMILAAILLLAGCAGSSGASKSTNAVSTPATPVTSTAIPSPDTRVEPADFLSESTKRCRSGEVVYQFAACPADAPQPWSDDYRLAVKERLDQLGEEAGFDISKQIAVAGRINAITAEGDAGRDIHLCRAMQGATTEGTRFYLSVDGSQERLAELIETTCPGNLDLLQD